MEFSMIFFDANYIFLEKSSLLATASFASALSEL